MDVEKIASLSKIELTEEEKRLFEKDFKKIIDWVGELKNIDTTNIKPFLVFKKMSMRDDIVENFENRKIIIDNFPEKEFDFVKVKKVIE